MALAREPTQCPTCFDLEKPSWDEKLMKEQGVRPPSYDAISMTFAEANKGAERGCAGCKVVSRIIEEYRHEVDKPVQIELTRSPEWEDRGLSKRSLEIVFRGAQVEKERWGPVLLSLKFMSVPDVPTGVVRPAVRSASQASFSAIHETD